MCWGGGEEIKPSPNSSDAELRFQDDEDGVNVVGTAHSTVKCTTKYLFEEVQTESLNVGTSSALISDFSEIVACAFGCVQEKTISG